MTPIWPAAEVCGKTSVLAHDNATIESLAASIHHDAYIRSHHPGHEARFPAVSKRRAWLVLIAVACGPAVVMTALLLGMQASGNLKCVDCVEARMQDTLRGAIIGFVTSAFLLSMMILPGVFTVAKNRFSLRHTRG